MKIYTRTGDKGETGLVYGSRVPKNSLRVEAYGTCDEANSMIGAALSFLPEDAKNDHWKELRTVLQGIQTTLFHAGAELATPQGKKVGWPLKEEEVTALEQHIDELDGQLPPLTNFILPGGHPAAALLHAARTVVRRAERCVVSVMQEEEVNPAVLKYLNRLSDLLFVAARYINHQLGVREPGLHEEG